MGAKLVHFLVRKVLKCCVYGIILLSIVFKCCKKGLILAKIVLWVYFIYPIRP